jgi:predicted nucleic acid-binding protein
MIVLDNSVIVPRYIAQSNSVIAFSALKKDDVWIVPPLWKFEFVNVLCTLRRSGNIDEWQAREAYARAQDDLGPAEIPVDQNAVLAIAMKHRISGYGAQYVALADMYGVLCVTNDEKLVERAKPITILMTVFATGKK